MKISLRSLLLLSMPLSLMACYDTDAEVDIKKDGTTKIRAEAILKKSAYHMFTQAAGEDFIKERCEAGGGKFDVDIDHVNCKVEADTSVVELVAGEVQSKNTHLPLDLTNLQVADNGDGTYTLNYMFDWSMFAAADLTADAASTEAAMDSEVKTQADNAEPESKEEKEEIKDAEKDASKDMKASNHMSKEILNYIDGYHIKITAKAPHILEGSGAINGGNDEMTMDIDLGEVNRNEQMLPENFMMVFSTEK